MPGRRPLGTYAAGMALVAALATAGCAQNGGTGTATSSTVPSASPTTSVAVTTSTSAPVPTTTSEADLAKAAAQRYVEAMNAALVARSTAEFRKTFVPGCIVCGNDADKMDTDFKSGRIVNGGRITYEKVEVESSERDGVVLKGTMTVSPVTVRDATGKVVESYPQFSNDRRMIVRRVEGVWLVSGIVG